MTGEPPGYSQLAFFPWLRLRKTHTVAGVAFVPLVDDHGATPGELSDAIDPLRSILGGYVDREGRSVDNCVVSVLPNVRWNVADTDFDRVQWAAALLFLACFSRNDYFPRFLGAYSNSSSFRVVWQRFGGDPVWVALVSRRRDGRTVAGGYKHGEVKFSVPLQCRLREPAVVDEDLLAALNRSMEGATMKRLRSALPFVSLANTDDDLMTLPAEAILMGSAFEQMLRGDASAFKLAKKFGHWFKPFGAVTVEEASNARPGIEIDTSKPEYAEAQPKWWVHRKWIEELYDLRSQSVHKGVPHGRTWGWSVDEHLLMAAWVFPLVVKLLLRGEGHYELTEDDTVRCLAVDKLLSITGWDEEPNDEPYRWREVVSETSSNYGFDRIMERIEREHPEWFPKPRSEES